MMKVLFIAFFAGILGANTAIAAEPQMVSGLIAVSALNDEWTPTTIKVLPGDVLLIHERGNKIVVGAYLGSTNANGTDGNIGALQLKIGSGAAQTIRAHHWLAVETAGVVKFKIYDTNYADNSGQFDVLVVHIPKSSFSELTNITPEP